MLEVDFFYLVEEVLIGSELGECLRGEEVVIVF